MFNVRPHSLIAMATLALAFVAGCETAPKTEAQRENLRDESQLAVQRLNEVDPNFKKFLDDRAYAYAVFPKVGKGGALVGGAYGRGAVYRDGNFIGWAELNQANVGLLIGGETFTEIIAFEDQATLDEFMNKGEFSLGANAEAVALTEGIGAKAQFRDGVAVFVKPNGGLMADLSIAGQKFNFQRTGTTADDDASRTASERIDPDRDVEVKTDIDRDRDGAEVDVDVDTNR